MAALDALENGHSVELLVTCLDFQPGKPNGIALALMARTKCPGIKVLLTGPLDLAPFAEGIGQFIEAPVSVGEIVAAAVRLLPPTPARRAA